jgi:hypothetical protein
MIENTDISLGSKMKSILTIIFAVGVLAFAGLSPAVAQQTPEQICQAKARNKIGCKCAVQTGGSVRENGAWTTPSGPGRQTFAACVEKNGGSMR